MNNQKNENAFNIKDIEDVIEFYNCWPSIRNSAIALKKSRKLNSSEKKLVHWMTEIVDRISQRDLNNR